MGIPGYIPNDTVRTTYNPVKLVLDGVIGVTPGVGTLITGTAAVSEAGTVLGIITASGKYTASDSTASDGSEVPRAVLLATADSQAADASIVIAKTGSFDASQLKFGGTDTIATAGVKVAMEDKNLYPVTLLTP
jgi:hypothetical protein